MWYGGKMTNEIINQIKQEIINEINKPKKVFIEVCREDVEIPKYAHIGDAGMDIRAAIDVELLPGETKIIPTGLKVAISEGYELQVRPRSGISFKTPLRISNSPGTIDSGYRDEIGIIMQNTSLVKENEELNTYTLEDKDNKQGKYIIKKGDRCAQIVLSKFENIEFVFNNVDDIDGNRNSGFGGSGIK